MRRQLMWKATVIAVGVILLNGGAAKAMTMPDVFSSSVDFPDLSLVTQELSVGVLEMMMRGAFTTRAEPRLNAESVLSTELNSPVITDLVNLVLGTPVNLNVPFGQPAEQVVFASGFTLPIYGQSLSSVYVGFDGSIGLNGSIATPGAKNISQFLLQGPQIAGANGNFLGTELGGTITATQFADNVLLSYRNIGGSSAAGSTTNNWDVQLFGDGRISFSYLGINEQNFILGVSGGGGVTSTEVGSFRNTSGSTGTTPTLYEVASDGTGPDPLVLPFELNGQVLTFTPVNPADPAASYSWQVQPIPEPSAAGMLSLGTLVLLAESMRKRGRRNGEES